MEVKTKNLTLEVKLVDDTGVFEGHGSAFDVVDSYGDVVVKGAFVKTLAERGRKVKLLWQHEQSEVIGVFDELYEDDFGLRVKGRLALNTQRGREAYELMKMNAIDSMSIGYTTVKDEYDPKAGVRYLKEIKLYEISLVTFPANEQATITRVKSQFDDLTEEQRESVLSFIYTLKQSSLSQTDEPQVENESEVLEEHSTEEEADTKQADEPLDDEIKHSLEKLINAMKR
jgi:HK97 family phage prohead protease